MKRPNVSALYGGREKRYDGNVDERIVVLALPAPNAPQAQASLNGDQNMVFSASTERAMGNGGRRVGRGRGRGGRGSRGGRGRGRPPALPVPMERTMVTRSMSFNLDTLVVLESMEKKGDDRGVKGEGVKVVGSEAEIIDLEVDSDSVVVLESVDSSVYAEVTSDLVVAFDGQEKNQEMINADHVVGLWAQEKVSSDQEVVDQVVEEEKNAEVNPGEEAAGEGAEGFQNLQDWPFTLTYEEEWMWSTGFSGAWWDNMMIPAGYVVEEEGDDPWEFDDIWGLRKITEIPEELQGPKLSKEIPKENQGTPKPSKEIPKP